LEQIGRRNPRAIDFGRYRIVDRERNDIMYGCKRMTLNEVKAWLAK
jgi:hypothetical protein